MNYYILASFFLSLFLSYILLPMIMDLLIKSNVLCENYKSMKIPTSLGILFIFTQVITLGVLAIFSKNYMEFITIYLFGFVFMGLLGLLDDLIGNKIVKGLKGHIGLLFKGVLSTGALKAIFGFLISLFVSLCISEKLLDIILNSLIIGLFTNLLNIFDLRPGRAIKVFSVFSAIFILCSISKDIDFVLYSIFGILLPYLALDLRAKAMMGDVGSNILGYTLGIYVAVNFNYISRSIILVLLTIIHLIAEKVSLSTMIQNNKILRFLDEIGR